MKTLFYKVKDSSGEILKDSNGYPYFWDDVTFSGFTKRINAGNSDCQLILARAFDNYGEDEDVSLGNIVEIYINDEDAKNLLIYSGYISTIRPITEGGKEKVDIQLLGQQTRLSKAVLKNSTQTTLYTDTTAGLTTAAAGSVADLGLVMRAIITRWQAEETNPIITTTAGQCKDTNTTETYTFTSRTYLDAINTVKGLSPSALWYWYLDENNVFNFRSDAITEHTFYFGKHLSSLKVEKRIDTIVNFVLIYNRDTGSPIYRMYTDNNSVNLYGTRTLKIQNKSIINTDIADKIGNRIINEMKNPDVRVEMDIIDNNESSDGYDIESIRPGDTFKLRGVNDALANTIYDDMQITEVQYRLDGARVIAEPVKSGIIQSIVNVNTKLDEIGSEGVGTTYTAA